MRTIVAGQEAITVSGFAELALGIDRDLFVGMVGESADERAVRLDVATEVLADLRQEDPELARYAAQLMRTAPTSLRKACADQRRAAIAGLAA